MTKQYLPDANIQKVGALLFTIIGIIAIVQPTGGLLGAFILVCVAAYMGGYLGFYRKFVFTDTCLEVQNWFGRVDTEIVYNELNDVYYHVGDSDGSTAREDAEIMIVIMKNGETHRLDVSPIDASEEMVELLKSKITE